MSVEENIHAFTNREAALFNFALDLTNLMIDVQNGVEELPNGVSPEKELKLLANSLYGLGVTRDELEWAIRKVQEFSLEEMVNGT